MKIYKSKEVELERFVILDSVTMKVGDIVKMAASGVDIADAVTDRNHSRGASEGFSDS